MGTTATLLAESIRLLAPHRDVILERVETPTPPRWCRERSWDAWLLSTETADCDSLADAPGSLGQLARDVDELLAQIPRATSASETSARPDHVKPRKHAQIAQLVPWCRRHFTGIQRVVDAGAGHGHLTRALCDALASEGIGYDRDPERVERANDLAQRQPGGKPLRFVTEDLPPLGADDLLIGLHACGSLGDRVVREGAEAGCQLLLVGCCAQKRDGAWRPLSCAAAAMPAWPRAVLGLANLYGNEGYRQDGGRLARHAVRLLLQRRGVDCAPGEEARGVHRRAFLRGVEAAAQAALAARALPAATRAELADVSARAEVEQRRIRRLSLPRNLLGRVLELSFALDRASFLEEAGLAAEVCTIFPESVSPRNLAVSARPPTSKAARP